jgi:hypothetical protein
VRHWIAALAMLVLVPTSAAAQPQRGFIGPLVQSYTVRADEVDGTLPEAGIGVALSVNPFLDFEGEVAKPAGTLRRQYSGISMSFAGPGASREEIERLGVLTQFTHERVVSSVVSFGVTFHPRRSGARVQPRVFTGVTTHFVRDRTRLAFLSWPATVTIEELRRMQPESESRRTIGSLTLGGGAGIDLTRTVVVIPELRYDYGSIGDELNDALRVGVRLMWRF